jgi:hypothetical protein
VVNKVVAITSIRVHQVKVPTNLAATLALLVITKKPNSMLLLQPLQILRRQLSLAPIMLAHRVQPQSISLLHQILLIAVTEPQIVQVRSLLLLPPPLRKDQKKALIVTSLLKINLR